MVPFKRILHDFFALLFPDLCRACADSLVAGEKYICTACLYDLPYTDFHLYADNIVARLFWGRVPCHAAMAMLYFRKGSRVQQLIHQLKYKDQTDLGITLGKMLGERLAMHADYHQAEVILPVPLHPKKERSRGYNQSRTIADGIALVLQLPVSSSYLLRERQTSTQTKKNRYRRFENMKSVFAVPNPQTLAGKHVLLVDDVITTGATLEACTQVLLEAGVSKISIAALAFAE